MLRKIYLLRKKYLEKCLPDKFPVVGEGIHSFTYFMKTGKTRRWKVQVTFLKFYLKPYHDYKQKPQIL